MAQLEVSDATARKLAELAERTNRSIDDLLNMLMREIADVDVVSPNAPGRASRLLAAAEEMNFASGQTDISEKSREILDSEFGDYLDDRMS